MVDTIHSPVPDRPDESSISERVSPDWLDRIIRSSVWLFPTVLALVAVSFLTNPVPDPSFPWATLPPSLQVGIVQPRIEHWPVTYTLGIWIAVFTLPLWLLWLYRQFGARGRPVTWLGAVPVTAMLALTTYCRFFWPKLYPASWNAPSYTLVCWAYCSTYLPAWSNAAYAVALFGVGAVGLAYTGRRRATYALAVWGVLAFPIGVPAIYEAWRRHGSR